MDGLVPEFGIARQDSGEKSMLNWRFVLAATTAMVVAGALEWKADATTLTGVGGLPT